MSRVYVEEIAENLYMLRVDDYDTKYFEALWNIPEGITYNAYVLTTDEGAVLFDTWKQSYADLFLETLRRVVDPRDIKYAVVHHMEPDHSGSLPRLLDVNSDITVVGHPIARGLIVAFYGREPRFRAVKDLEVLDVGDEKLRFIHIPWLHWPDTIATFLENRKVLLSSDAFGGYGAPPSIYDDDPGVVERYMPMVRKYLATVVGHYREYIVKNIDKIASLGIDLEVVAPAHGLVWRRRPKTIVEFYRRLGNAEPEKGKIVVIYSSMYGFAQKTVNALVTEVLPQSTRVKTFGFTDVEQASIGDILGESIDAQAIVLCISNYEGRLFPTMEHVVKVLGQKVNAEKPIVVVNTYGWGKISEEYVRSLLAGTRLKLVDIVYIRGSPRAEDIERLRQAIGKLL